MFYFSWSLRRFLFYIIRTLCRLLRNLHPDLSLLIGTFSWFVPFRLLDTILLYPYTCCVHVVCAVVYLVLDNIGGVFYIFRTLCCLLCNLHGILSRLIGTFSWSIPFIGLYLVGFWTPFYNIYVCACSMCCDVPGIRYDIHRVL